MGGWVGLGVHKTLSRNEPFTLLYSTPLYSTLYPIKISEVDQKSNHMEVVVVLLILLIMEPLQIVQLCSTLFKSIQNSSTLDCGHNQGGIK